MTTPKRRAIWQVIVGVIAVTLLAGIVVAGVMALAAGRAPKYSQETPDDVVRSAVAMVKNGDAQFLPELLSADSDEMRTALRRLGVLTGHLQGLARAIGKRFPQEVAKYRDEARQAALEGKTPSIVAALAGRSPRKGPDSDEQGAQEAAVRGIIARLFSDPYGWIEENEGRLSTLKTTDDIATLLVDDKPLGGVGIPLKLDKGKWYIALPTNMPPISQAMPRSPEQWSMINSLIKVLDNTVVELEADVREGRLTNLKAIGDRAQQKIIFPGALWVAAYAADLDARQRVDRAVRRYRDRQKIWARSRQETPAPEGAEAGVSDKLGKALEKIAAKEIEPAVRARKWQKVADLTDKQFEDLLSGWLRKYRLAVSLTGSLKGPSIDEAVASWELGPGKELVTPAKKKAAAPRKR